MDAEQRCFVTLDAKPDHLSQLSPAQKERLYVCLGWNLCNKKKTCIEANFIFLVFFGHLIMLHEFLRTCPVYKYMLKQVYFVHRKTKTVTRLQQQIRRKGKTMEKTYSKMAFVALPLLVASLVSLSLSYNTAPVLV